MGKQSKLGIYRIKGQRIDYRKKVNLNVFELELYLSRQAIEFSLFFYFFYLVGM